MDEGQIFQVTIRRRIGPDVTFIDEVKEKITTTQALASLEEVLETYKFILVSDHHLIINVDDIYEVEVIEVISS